MWAKECTKCQSCKIGRHTCAPLGEFERSGRFEHVHIDIFGPLPSSQGKQFVVTMIDRASRWPEAIPTNIITAQSIANIFIENWVAQFGVPARISSDQGRQFNAEFLQCIMQRLGVHKIRTCAYHPQSNGRIKRWHRPFKAALMAYATEHWVEILPLILLGLRVAINSDLGVSPAQLTYGADLKLPGDFFVSDNSDDITIKNANDFVQKLAKAMRDFTDKTCRHGNSPVYVPAELSHCSYVFLRTEVRGKLTPPYSGPYPVVERDEKAMLIMKDGESERVTIDQLKPAFILQVPVPAVMTDTSKSVPAEPKPERPKRTVRFVGKYPR